MGQSTNFFSLYRHNFVRVAIGIPAVRVADPEFNVTQVVMLMQQAAESKALLVVFPELGLSAYSCEDLFHQQALLGAARDGLRRVLDASRDIPVLAIVGVPVSVDNAPKVGSGGSLLPRSDCCAPSDAEATARLAQSEGIPDTER